MNKKRKTLIWLCAGLGAVLCLLVAVVLIADLNCLKAPESYTWEAYQAMSNEEKDQLFHRFDSLEDFEAWMDSVQPKDTLPDFQWNEPGKQPDAYTWEEYLALSAEKKEAFYQWFSSAADFESWKNGVCPEESTPVVPVWSDQEKQPNEYTWSEYQSLSLEEQEAFYLWFDSQEAFESWMNDANPEEHPQTDRSWDSTEKKPNQYTWTEYQALSPEDQDAFFLWFDSLEDFEAWMDMANPEEQESKAPSWNKPGKDPDEYTWAEYQSLSPEEQDAFYLWFEDKEAFEDWVAEAEKTE